jgi:MFS family permease
MSGHTVTSDPSAAKAPPSLWRNRDFLLLEASQAVSLIGSQFSLLAFPLLVLALTNSASQAGLVTALRTLPYACLCLPAGGLVDRWDRKRVMIICDAGRAINLAGLVAAAGLGGLTIVHLAVVALIEGVLFVFFDIAQVASLPHIAPKEQLPAVTSSFQFIYTLAALVGPVVGGLLFSIDRLLPFIVDAISYAVSSLALLFIRTRFQHDLPKQQGKDILTGLKWLWSQKLVRYFAFISGIYNCIWAGAPLVTLILVRQLGASTKTIGLAFTLIGIGALGGALLVPFLQRRFRLGHTIITIVWLWVFLWPLQAIVHEISSLVVITAVSVGLSSIYDVSQFSYRLSLIPDELQGRVNSVFRLIALGLQPLGVAAIGLLLENLGTSSTIGIVTIPLLIVALVTLFNSHMRSA